MLSALPDAGHPDEFSQSDLFRKCREMGIIPQSDNDLNGRQEDGAAPVVSRDSGSDPSPGPAPFQQAGQLDLSLIVEGMWCPACAWIIETVLKRTRGVTTAVCSFSTDRVLLSYDPVALDPHHIVGLIHDIGYRARLPDEPVDARLKRKELLRLIICAGLTLNVMMFSFALYGGFVTAYDPGSVHYLSWLIFLMTTVVLAYGGHRIFRRAVFGAIHLSFGMETLVGLGALSAYFYSIVNLTLGSLHIYFDTAAMLITLVLLGKTLEGRARSSVQADLGRFLSLRPTKVRICTAEHPDGRYVNLGQLHPNDVFRVEASETVPADGEVIEGGGHIDESSISGEARPRGKEIGDSLESGTRLIEGSLKARAIRVGKASMLGQMIQVMERTLATQSPLEEKTDRVLRWFVPAIVLLAVGTSLVCRGSGMSWEAALIRAITVLVVACPCALGIAIPMARIAGITLAYRRGILVRNFRAFARAARIDVFVFDKTGTLTRGEWELLEILPTGKRTEEEICSLALALEESSHHPIASAFRKYAVGVPLHPIAQGGIEFHENGITAGTDQGFVKIGSRVFVSTESDASDSKTGGGTVDPKEERIHSTVYMSIDGNSCARFLFGDELRPEAGPTIARLKGMGIPVSIISGDSHGVTRMTGESIGCREAVGDLSPLGKASRIGELQKKGTRVAMVGDGVNDAPALAQSDLSIAVPGATGSHLTRETADITLVKGDLAQIPAFLELAGAVNRKIHQNLAWAFVYNIASLPLALAGLLTPLVAVSAMLLSSLSVIANSLLLLRSSR